MFVCVPPLTIHCINNGILNKIHDWFSCPQRFLLLTHWFCPFQPAVLTANRLLFSSAMIFSLASIICFENNNVITIVGLLSFDVDWFDIDIIRVVGIYDARWAGAFARASPPPLKLEDPSNWVGKRGWRKPFTKNGVCVVDACTELLMANSTFERNLLQFG